MIDSIYLTTAITARFLPSAISQQFQQEIKWPDGRRLPDESKAVLLAAHYLMKELHIGHDRNLGKRFGLVMAAVYGGMASYEKFQASLENQNGVQPLAFSMALPCIPSSVLSLYYGILGPVISLSSSMTDAGQTVLPLAWPILAQGNCDQLLVGSWYFPSATGLKHTQTENALISLLHFTACDKNSCPEFAFELPLAQFSSPILPLAKFFRLPNGFLSDDEAIKIWAGETLTELKSLCDE